MAKSSTLLALLEADHEPTHKTYIDTVDDVVRNPRQISSLVGEDVRNDVLILLSTRSLHLAQFYRRLRFVARQNTKAPDFNDIATETVVLLIHTLSELHQLLEPSTVLDFLVPALDVCFASPRRPALRELASVLGSSGVLLEHLVSDHLGVEIIRQWASMQNMTALDADTLGLWTEKLVNMVQKCAIDHHLALETEQWHMLKALRTSLQNLAHSMSKSSSKHSSHLPALGSMKPLNREDKSRTSRH